MEEIKLISSFDKLNIAVSYLAPEKPKAIIQIVHGMSEHKERYYPFMHFLSQNGYMVIIHDHRGHGASVENPNDLGDFYTTDIKGIVGDMLQVSKYAKDLYPDLPLYIFAHSMGTLVTRCFLKKYDDLVDKVVLCGAPTRNYLADFGIVLAKIRNSYHQGPDDFLNNLAMGPYNKKFNAPYLWLSKSEANIRSYKEDNLCGFVFKTNGFVNLFTLLKESFCSDYLMLNPNLKIFLIGGSDDPVIGGENKFKDLENFLVKRGYKDVIAKLYPTLRHEILNEEENEIVYNDVLLFFNN